MHSGRGYNGVSVGDRYDSALTLTETHSDTLSTNWTVTRKDPKPKHQGGMVSLSGSCTNQEGIKVAEVEAKMLVADN